jgi:hypothetical protein
MSDLGDNNRSFTLFLGRLVDVLQDLRHIDLLEDEQCLQDLSTHEHQVVSREVMILQEPLIRT